MPPPADGFVARLLLGPALRTQPDGRLVKLVREGYEAAFDEIVRRYGSALRRYAAAIVGGSAEDVTQDALSKAFVALRRDDKEIELRPWLYRILRNTALNDLRDRPPRTAELGDSIEGPRGVAEEVERREEIDELIERLHALPEPQRAAIVMRELEGLGHDEIAAALGISGGAARQAIHRARTTLRDGFGMAIPLPLLKLMLEGGGPAAEVAAGGAGAGIVLKAATATVLVAGTLGAGMALHDNGHGRSASASANGGGRGSAQQSAGLGQLATTSSASWRSAGAHDGQGSSDSSGRDDGTAGRSEDGESRHEGGNQSRSGPHDGAGDEPSDSQPTHEGSGPGGGGSTGGEHSGSGDNTLSDGGGESSSDSGSGDGMGGSGTSGGEQVSDSEDGSGSNSGPDSGGGEEPSISGSGGSRDSGNGEGFSGQMQPKTQEER